MGMPGFERVLRSVLDAFQNRREEVNAQASLVTSWLNQSDVDGRSEVDAALDAEVLIEAAQLLERNFDFQYGGFGSAPKFPHAMELELLMRLIERWPDHVAPGKDIMLRMVELTLMKMAQGGIFDQLAGGFARYSVDQQWLVPHFEKMLYDNVLIACVCLECFRITHNKFYETIARQTLDYVLNYMTGPQGCFYSSEDADSEGEEGKFYVWSKNQIVEALGEETGELFCKVYGVSEYGNFEGHNILYLPKPIDQFSELHGLPRDELAAQMQSARDKLLRIRDQRIRPGKDDKVLTNWNALAISALARAAFVLSEPRYGDAARKAARFIFDNLRRDDGRLLHSWRAGTAKIDGFLDDYAFLIVAMLDLYHFEFDEDWISLAVQLAEMMVEHFEEPVDGGFYFTADDQEQLIARSKAVQDSSIPSGYAMAAWSLLRLGRLIDRMEWIEKARRAVAAAVPAMRRSVFSNGQLLIVLDELLRSSTELVLVASSKNDVEDLLQLIQLQARPGVSVVAGYDARSLKSANSNNQQAPPLRAAFRGKIAVDGIPTLYVCRSFTCDEPAVGRNSIVAAIEKMRIAPAVPYR
jgi:uncharacterized protein YyaL (SSP411 family)